jgi:hypothetical protein
MAKRLLLAIFLVLAVLEPLMARTGTRRSPTQLDDTSWKVKRIDGRPVRATPPSISFYSNGRVQIGTLCSVFLAADFGVLLWRVWTTRLDKPSPRLPCGPVATEEEALTFEIMNRLKSFALRENGQVILLKDSRGRVIEAHAKS